MSSVFRLKKKKERKKHKTNPSPRLCTPSRTTRKAGEVKTKTKLRGGERSEGKVKRHGDETGKERHECVV